MFQKDDWMTTEQGSAQPGTGSRPVKLACRNVWKLFGANAANFIRERDGKASMADVTAAGLVGAVRAVDLEIRQSEIFIIMGLSASRRWCAACRGWSSRATARSSSKARTCSRYPTRH
jgi:glycine betaine/proline transport system ATP-binding protein